MSEIHLQEGVHVSVTPAGAYFAVSSPDLDPARILLTGLLIDPESRLMSPQWLAELLDGQVDGKELLARLQTLGWIQGEAQPRGCPTPDMEQEIPELLGQLSGSGKALLADADGFYLARCGVAHETAEELSALSADLASLQGRHKGLLSGNLRIGSAAWSLVDAAGHSQLGVWPLWVAGHRFALTLLGQPRLNTIAYRDLVWSLWQRYGTKEQPSEPSASPTETSQTET